MFQDTILCLWERKTCQKSGVVFFSVRSERRALISQSLAFDDNVIILSRTLSRENKDSYEGGG